MGTATIQRTEEASHWRWVIGSSAVVRLCTSCPIGPLRSREARASPGGAVRLDRAVRGLTADLGRDGFGENVGLACPKSMRRPAR